MIRQAQAEKDGSAPPGLFDPLPRVSNIAADKLYLPAPPYEPFGLGTGQPTIDS